MNRVITVLAALLGVQLILTAWLGLREADSARLSTDERLVPVDTARFDRLVIEEPNQPPLELVKMDGQWRIPGLHDFPADAARVTRFVETVTALPRGWPVATSAEAAERFKTTDAAFTRRITFGAADAVLAKLYLGTSPGFRQSHARVDGDDDVYVVNLNPVEATTRADDWIDRAVIKQDLAKVEQATLHELQLLRKDNAWTLQPLNEGETANATAIEQLVRQMADLPIFEVLGVEEKPEYGLKEPALEYTLTVGGQPVTYRFGKPKNASHYVLKTSTLPFYFRIAEFPVKRVADQKREALVNGQPAAAPEGNG